MHQFMHMTQNGITYMVAGSSGASIGRGLKAGQGFTTLELKVAYHRAMTKDTGPVQAEGWVISLGRRAAFAEGRIIDAEGRLYATATSTLLVFDR